MLTGRLVGRARRSGRLRPDVVADDLTFLLEGAAAIRLPDAARTAELRRRYVELFLSALVSPEPPGLPGSAPTPGELNWRWRPGPRWPRPGPCTRAWRLGLTIPAAAVRASGTVAASA